MAPSFLGTSTNISAAYNVSVHTSAFEASQDTSSGNYILSVLLFSAIFSCGFVLVWFQIKGGSRRDEVSSVKPTRTYAAEDVACISTPDSSRPCPTSCTSNAVELRKVGSPRMEQICVGRRHSSPAALSLVEKQSPRHKAARVASCRERLGVEPTLGQDLRSAALGSAVQDGDVVDGWVGSAEWAACRAARKKSVQTGLFGTKKPGKKLHVGAKFPPAPTESFPQAPSSPPPKLGTFARPLCKRLPGDLKAPQAPSMPAPKAPLTVPPELDVLQMDQEGVDGLATANTAAYEELQRSALEDVTLRRKIFKNLCAKWHPDKNLSGDVELATEVFQYLQAQKEWYLRE